MREQAAARLRRLGARMLKRLRNVGKFDLPVQANNREKFCENSRAPCWWDSEWNCWWNWWCNVRRSDPMAEERISPSTKYNRIPRDIGGYLPDSANGDLQGHSFSPSALRHKNIQ
jgi:hypothetical protein